MRRVFTTAAVLCMAMMLCAASTDSLYADFSKLIEEGDASKAMSLYDDIQNKVQKDYATAQRRYEKAMDAGNLPKAQKAREDMRRISLEAGQITEEDSDAFLSLILRTEDADESLKMAQWLYKFSPFYTPKVTYDWSGAGDGFSYRLSRSISVAPGTEIRLPSAKDLGLDTSISGVLEGWGITKDEVLYQPGDVIKAPFTSQTYYAIWTDGIAFDDEVTGYSASFDEDTISVPKPEAPDDSYIFAGWYDKSSGEYIAPDDEEYSLTGHGASFEALWKKVEISDLDAKPYDLSSLPLNTQIELSFSLKNAGTENLRNCTVELSSSSDGVKIEKSVGRISSLTGEVNATGLRIVVTQPGVHDISIAFTDRDGDTWSETFQITAG